MSPPELCPICKMHHDTSKRWKCGNCGGIFCNSQVMHLVNEPAGPHHWVDTNSNHVGHWCGPLVEFRFGLVKCEHEGQSK